MKFLRNRPKGQVDPANRIIKHKNPFSQNAMYSNLNPGILPEILIGVDHNLLVSATESDHEHVHGASVLQAFNRNFVLRPLNSGSEKALDFSDQLVFDLSRPVHQSINQQQQRTIGQSRLSGYIIKPVVSNDTNLGKRNDNIGAEISSQLNRLIPVETLDQLSDHVSRENFIQRVCVMHRWQHLVENEDESIYPLIRFHKRHSHLYQSHDPDKANEIKAILSRQDSIGIHELYMNYIHQVMDILKRMPSPQSHVVALRQMLGAVESFLSGDEHNTVHKSIRSYQLGEETIKIPLTLLRYHASKYSIPELMNSVYLYPYPQESLFVEQSEVAIAI